MSQIHFLFSFSPWTPVKHVLGLLTLCLCLSPSGLQLCLLPLYNIFWFISSQLVPSSLLLYFSHSWTSMSNFFLIRCCMHFPSRSNFCFFFRSAVVNLPLPIGFSHLSIYFNRINWLFYNIWSFPSQVCRNLFLMSSFYRHSFSRCLGCMVPFIVLIFVLGRLWNICLQSTRWRPIPGKLWTCF